MAPRRDIVHSVPIIAALPDRASEGSMVIVADYYPDIPGGGGAFYWKGGRNKREHNGGTIIDPTHSIRPGDAGYWTSEHTANGVWVRCADGVITRANSVHEATGYLTILLPSRLPMDVSCFTLCLIAPMRCVIAPTG